jgi:hypothetical protein
MSRYIARIIRALVVNTLCFGGGCGLLVFIFFVVVGHDANAAQMAWKAGLIIGLLSSFLLLAVMLPLDFSTHLFLAKGLYKEIWDLEQTREVVVTGSAKDVTQATKQALLTVPCIQSVSVDTTSNVTKATTGASWRSPGEELIVEIASMQDDTWKLRCVSRCTSKNAVFDYGKNYENVEVWQKTLHESLASGATPA